MTPLGIFSINRIANLQMISIPCLQGINADKTMNVAYMIMMNS